MYLDVKGTHEGTHFRVRAPDIEALQDLRRVCQEHGIPFHLQSLYHEKPDDPTERFRLTSKQHEVLIRAYERGYFDQPRCITLEELAEEFNVTPSALGRRIRRALNTLIDETLRSKTEVVNDQPSPEGDTT